MNFVNCDGTALCVVFPHQDESLVERVRRMVGTTRVSVRTRANSAFPCPGCGVLSRRAHISFLRRIADTDP